MKMNSLTISIPAYNEEQSLPVVIDEALAIGPKLAKTFELLLVDDGSTDNTGRIIDEYAQKYKTIKVIRHKKNKGFSGAIRSCYQKASNEWIFLVPGDGQISIKTLESFLPKTIDADVIVGYRLKNPEPFSRKLNSAIFHLLYKILFGVHLREISTAILWKKSVLDSINITASDRSALIQPEVIYKAWKQRAKFAEVGFDYKPRIAGIPKGTDAKMIILTIKEMLRLFTQMRLQ